MAAILAEQRKLASSLSLGSDTTPRAKHGGMKANNRRRPPCNPSFRTKIGSAGGKGRWGSLMDDRIELRVDRDDPNYDSDEDSYCLVVAPVAESVEEFKGRVALIIDEYFVSSSIAEAAQELRDLRCPDYHHYFVKKLVSMAMHNREKEMAAVLLSALYADVIMPEQLVKGFTKLLLSVDDLVSDVPDAADTLALFLARAVVDDILPPVFLSDVQKFLIEGSRGMKVIQTVLNTNLTPQLVERKWGGSHCATVELVRKQIDGLLQEYLVSGDKAQACECIRQLDVPFHHHEVVKRALFLAMEKSSQPHILALLKQCADEGLISSNQMSKGFTRILDSLHDLVLNIPQARELLQPLISRAIEDGWLNSSFATSFADVCSILAEPNGNSDFKKKATAIIQEYFSSDDIPEVTRSLQDVRVTDVHALFIKRLIMLAMDRKNREKEMASVLLAAMYPEVTETDQVAKAFIMLLESAEDTALDIPDAATELAFFLGRAVYDDILPPFYLEEIKGQLPDNSLGREIVANAKSILSARHAGERILRCWGGGTGWAVEDAKDKIIKMLEEYEAGGDMTEACRCIRELDMPFFHHEIVKKALEMAMEKQNDKLLGLLRQCAEEGLITTSQMSRGFKRVLDSLDDLALDIPDAETKLWSYVHGAKQDKWLSRDFSGH